MGHTDVVPASRRPLAARPVRWRARRRRGLGTRGRRHAQPHGVDGRGHAPAGDDAGVPARRHARVPGGRRRGGARHLGRRPPDPPRARRGGWRLRGHRVGRHPRRRVRRHRAVAGHGRREGLVLVHPAGVRHPRPRVAAVRHRQRPGHSRRGGPTAWPSFRPAAQINDTWRRFLGGPRPAPRPHRGAARPRPARCHPGRPSGGHGAAVPLVHAHHDRPDGGARRHQDQRDPRPRRPAARRPHAAGPGAVRRAGPARRGARRPGPPRRDRRGVRRPGHRVAGRHARCGTASAAWPGPSTPAATSCP